jgi:hypothetical protein
MVVRNCKVCGGGGGGGRGGIREGGHCQVSTRHVGVNE